MDIVPGTFILFLRSCRSWVIALGYEPRAWVFKVCSIMSSWGFGSLWIWDPKFLFHHGIPKILDLDFLVLKWEPGDPGS